MNIELTDEQLRLLDETTKWFRNPDADQVFQYSASAGCGKSFIMHVIIDRLGLEPKEVAPMAPTGSAAIIMRLNGFSSAKTIHSSIYQFQIIHDRNGNPKRKFIFVGLDPDIKLICLDEASMCGTRVAKDLEKTGVKILACGDLNQLPPVKDQPAYLTDEDKIFKLTKIFRQAEGSSIVNISRMVLSGKTPSEGDYGDVLVIRRSELFNNIYDIVKNYGIIICGTNKTRDDLNNVIRNDVYKYNTPLPCKGEKLICRKNNWEIELDGINLVNGLYGTAMSSPSISSFKDGYFELDFQPQFMDQPFTNLQADYHYFRADFKERMELRNAVFQNDYEKFEYAYTITTHVSQGSQFNTGIYLQEYLPSHNNNLNYTGITRFRNKAIYVIPDRRRFWNHCHFDTLIPIQKVNP